MVVTGCEKSSMERMVLMLPKRCRDIFFSLVEMLLYLFKLIAICRAVHLFKVFMAKA